jgi:hypothetical protein
MPGARFAGEPRYVVPGVTAGCEEIRHHHDLARTLGDAGSDRLGQARCSDREVRCSDASPGQPPSERGRDACELGVRGVLAAAVIDQDHGPPAGGLRHQ